MPRAEAERVGGEAALDHRSLSRPLRRYLEYARSGILEAVEETAHEPDSDFEIAVIEVLRGMGYEVTPQLGVSGFRPDIAVKHPEHR